MTQDISFIILLAACMINSAIYGSQDKHKFAIFWSVIGLGLSILKLIAEAMGII